MEATFLKGNNHVLLHYDRDLEFPSRTELHDVFGVRSIKQFEMSREHHAHPHTRLFDCTMIAVIPMILRIKKEIIACLKTSKLFTW